MLIVEDEDILAVNLMTYIQRFGWDVRIASTGLQALATADEFRPDVLLLDYHLPDMTGFQILDAIHTDCYRCDCGCVLMTAHPTATVLAGAGQRGIHRILHKPFSLSELDVHLSATTAALRPSSFPGPLAK
jgi:DNA-binding response OmpR family regulator